MNDPNEIRINELARELEVRAKTIIDYLPEVGVSEKKTHSSSIDVTAARLVRQHFRDLARAEASAEEKAVKQLADGVAPTSSLFRRLLRRPDARVPAKPGAHMDPQVVSPQPSTHAPHNAAKVAPALGTPYAPVIVTHDELRRMRLKLIHLVDHIEGRRGNRQESIAKRISRLSEEGRIPANIDIWMHTLLRLRNESEYNDYSMSSDESIAVRAAWVTVTDWGKAKGWVAK